MQAVEHRTGAYLCFRCLLRRLLKRFQQCAGIPKGRSLLAVGEEGEVLCFWPACSAHLPNLQHLFIGKGSLEMRTAVLQNLSYEGPALNDDRSIRPR